MINSNILRASTVILVLLVACKRQDSSAAGDEQKNTISANIPQSITPDILADIIGPFNRGIALMDQYKAADAAAAFRAVTAKAPQLIAGHLNLGIALLNTQLPEDLGDCENEFKWVIAKDPANPYAHYSLGMLYKHLNRYAEARIQFQKVLEADPGDGDAHYQYAILIIDEQPDEARLHLEKTLEIIPHHEAALYRLNKLLQAVGEQSAANTSLRRYHQLKSAGAGVIYGMKYGEMGRYAEVVRTLGIEVPGMTNTPLQAYRDVAENKGLTFKSYGRPGLPGQASITASAAFGPGVTLAFKKDLTATLLYVTGSGPGGDGLLLEYADGKFKEVKDTGINGQGAIGAFFGDYDQDGDADLYLTCAGANRFYHNESDTAFTDITAGTQTAGANVVSVGAAWADADHDGDLDLYVANYAGLGTDRGKQTGARNNLWQNNGDGTFTDIAESAGVDGGAVSTMSVLFYDLDNDRDQDLYLINDASPNRIFYNDRVGQYTDMTAKLPLLADAGPGLGALAGDIDNNGLADILLLRGAAPPVLLLHKTRDIFIKDKNFNGGNESITSTAGGLLGDLDLDGDLDIILLSSTRSGKIRDEILLNDGRGHFAEPVTLGESGDSPDARGALAFDFDGNGSLEVLITQAAGPPALWQAELPPDQHWLEILPIVKNDAGEIWPDASANGCAIECKADRLLQIGNLQGGAGYLSSQTVMLHFGLGNQSRADYVRLTWPDALFQTESEVTADLRWQVTKIEKKPSSCPMLFSWDGSSFSFVTDLLGVGGVGFFIEPGFYGPPDPTEDILIPAGQIQPRGGRYLLSVTEPLEEASYIDQLYLIAYDHPEKYEIYPDERFTCSPPFPTGEPRCVGKKIFPVTAKNSLGNDISDALSEIDRKYAEPPLDTRFTGFAKDHWLELDFGDELQFIEEDEKIILYLYGWVEYTYSHVNYAAYQAGISMQPPRIEVPDGNGGWQVAIQEAGFPAGLPRMMTLDISSLPLNKSGVFRIRTNMEIYWDQIFAGVDVCGSEIRQTILQPVAAGLKPLGYPREYSPDGKNPTLYDYQRIDTGVPFKNMTGNYTRFGDVRELLETVDDKFVIMGHGEEIALEFSVKDLPMLPKDWARTFVLHSDGYCKDMDLYTAYPNTIGPLPHHSMANYPPEFSVDDDGQIRYRQQWNTRTVTGY